MKKNFNFLLVSLSRKIRAYFKSETANHPITFEQLRILGYILRFEGINQSDLADLLETKKISISKGVDALVALDLLKRIKSERDKRHYHLFLTPDGQVVANNLKILSDSFFEKITLHINNKDLDVFFNVLEQIHKNIDDLTKD